MAHFKMLDRVLLGFMLGLVLHPALVTASPPPQISDAPYLMAYNDQPAPHFVLERADGSDSRIFGEGQMPGDTNIVSGPGWSPSGQWFAWTANTQYKESDRGSTAYVLSADGQTRPTGLDDLGRVSLAWSPNADVLVVAGLLNPPFITYEEGEGYVARPEADSLVMRMGIFDPATDKFIVVQDLPAPYERDQLLEVRFRVQWRNDGEYGYVQTPGLDADGLAMTRFFFMNLDGGGGDSAINSSVLMYEDILYNAQPVLTAYGEFEIRLDDGSIRMMEVGGDRFWYLQVTGDEAIQNAYWSPDGERALVTSQLECQEAGCPQQGLWLYTRADNQLTNLLPAQAAPFTLYPAPDFSHVIAIETRSDGRYAIYVEAADRTPIDLGKVIDTQEYYEDDPVVRWTNATRFVLATQRGDGGMNTFAAYEISEDAPLPLGQFTAQSYGTIPPLAPNRAITLVNFDTVALIDVTSGENVILPPDPRRYFTNPYGDARWHPTEDWALLEENAAVAGGGAPIYSGVVNADGSVRRPLGGCFAASSICVSWLPPQVDPTTLAPGYDNTPVAPITRIAVGHWTDEIIWSPDMRQIATAGDFRFNQYPGPFEVWQVSDGTQITTFEVVAPQETITWTGGQPAITPVVKHPLAAEFGLITVAPDGSQFARYMVDYITYTVTLELFDPEGNVLVTLQDVLTSDWHTSLSYSPDGQYLAVSSAQGPVRVVDTSTGEVVAELPLIYSGAVAFSPDGTQLAVAYATEIWVYGVGDILAR